MPWGLLGAAELLPGFVVLDRLLLQRGGFQGRRVHILQGKEPIRGDVSIPPPKDKLPDWCIMSKAF